MKSHGQVKGSQNVLKRSKKHVLKSHQHFDMNEDLSGDKIHHLVKNPKSKQTNRNSSKYELRQGTARHF